ncbi:hypothetical protein M426DRAFT_14001 [Hypoxylon sp. CI-4A]|nr:hypothetical protein M426DRAFT_14001 [Hypoxylon sp. CI-4A]
MVVVGWASLPVRASRSNIFVPRCAIMRRAFQPFLLGDRGCAGKAMAYLELSMALAKTIWYFDFGKVPGEAGKVGEGISGRTGGRDRQDEFQLYDGVVVSHDGPNLGFKLREKYSESIEAGEGD